MSTWRILVTVLPLIHPVLSQPVTSTCEIPSVERGENATLTIRFGQDLRKEGIRDFSVDHIGQSSTASQTRLLDCESSYGNVTCRKTSCCTWESHVTNVFRVYIHNVSQELEGRFFGFVIPADTAYQKSCNFSLKASTCHTDTIITTNSHVFCTNQPVTIGQTCTVTCNPDHYFPENQTSVTYMCVGKNKWCPEMRVTACEVFSEQPKVRETHGLYFLFLLLLLIVPIAMVSFIFFKRHRQARKREQIPEGAEEHLLAEMKNMKIDMIEQSYEPNTMNTTHYHTLLQQLYEERRRRKTLEVTLEKQRQQILDPGEVSKPLSSRNMTPEVTCLEDMIAECTMRQQQLKDTTKCEGHPVLTSAENYWLQCIETWYPELHSRSYFLPPLHFNQEKLTMKNIAGKEVYVPENTQSNPRVHYDRALQRVLLGMQALADNGQEKEVMFVVSQLQFENYLGEPTFAPAVALLPRSSTLPKELREQHFDKGDFDVLIIHSQHGLFTLQISSVGEDFSQQTMTDQENDVSQQTMTDQENDVSQQTMTDQVNDVSQQPMTDQENDVSQQPMTDQENDVSQQTMTDQENDVSQQTMTDQENDVSQQPMTDLEQAVLIEKVEEITDHLNKAEVVLKHLTSDLKSGINITKCLVMPNITSGQLKRAIERSPSTGQFLCECLGAKNVDDAVKLCLLKYQLSDNRTPSDIPSSIQALREWWQHVVRASRSGSFLTSSLYKQLVARFCGPATTVEVHCVTAPRLNIRTLGEAVSETGERVARLVLIPQQVDILNQSPPQAFLSGPPGTGKTIVLIMQGLTWIQRGYDVHVVSTWNGSRAVTFVIEHQLQETAKTSTAMSQETAKTSTARSQETAKTSTARSQETAKTLTAGSQETAKTLTAGSRVHLHQFDFLKDGEVKTAVSYLKSLSEGRHLCVIADEVVRHDRKSFSEFCDQLIKEVPGVFIWGASVHHDIRPLCLEEFKLTTPLRSPQVVVREVMEAVEIKNKQVHDYTVSDLLVPTDGPPIMRIKHRKGHSGHTGYRPRDCVECGHQVARVLTELNIGRTGNSNGPPHLQYHDVLVLCYDYPTDDRVDSNGQVTRTASGLVRGLRDCHVPVRVVEKGDEAAIRYTALGVGDLVTVANWRDVQGLERKVVVVERIDEFDRLYAMSRCTSQLVLIDC